MFNKPTSAYYNMACMHQNHACHIVVWHACIKIMHAILQYGMHDFDATAYHAKFIGLRPYMCA